MSETTSTKSHKYDLGVLFVHGIGQQAQGDTLVRFGEPVQRWLQRWLGEAADVVHQDRVKVVRASFRPGGGDERVPAQAALAVNGLADPDDPAADTESAWFFAESWWADAFLSPGFQDIANWGFRILPWSLSTHFATRTRRTIRAFGHASRLGKLGVGVQLIIDIFSFILALLLFPLVVSLLMVILIVGVLPIPRVRAFAAQLQQMLARTLGDSFVLIASPFQEAVIVGKVERDIQWMLSQDCRRVAIVAHSQGAAVAHAALKRVLPEVKDMELIEGEKGELLFVTVGSGLNKLSEIRHLRGKSNPRDVWFAPAGFLLSALSLPEAISSLQSDNLNIYAIIFVTMGVGLLIWGILQAWEEIRPRPSEITFKTNPPVKWLDFYASADPVPNGAMYDSPEQTRQVMDSREVMNGASALMDHTTYWANSDEFMGYLCSALCDHAGVVWRKPGSLDHSHLAVAGYRRRWRTGWLKALRLTIALLTTGVVALNWSNLAAVASGPWQALSSFLHSIPLIRSFVSVENLDTDISHVLGILVFVTIGFIVYFVLSISWAIWYRSDLAALFERRRYRALSSSFVGFVLLFILAMIAFGLALMGFTRGIVPGFLASIASWLVLTLSLSFVVLAIIGISYAIFRLIKSLALLLWKLTFAKREDNAEAQADTAPATIAEAQVINWGSDLRLISQVILSMCILVVITFPYMAMITSNMPLKDLFRNCSFQEATSCPNQMMLEIEQAASGSDIELWQWMSIAFLIVVIGNITGILGGFSGLRTWFRKISRAEPTAVVHARHLDEAEAIEVLEFGASLVMKEIDDEESELRRLIAARIEDIEANARDLRRHAWEAYQILTRLPADHEKGEQWLAQLARIMPAAAIMWAARYGEKQPVTAGELLTLHLDQPKRKIRRRVKRALWRMEARVEYRTPIKEY